MSDVQKSYILQREAKILFETGNVIGCVDVISYAINLNHVIPFFLLRASCYLKLHKFPDAYFDYCFAIQIEPEVASHFSQRGLCLARLKKLDMALEDLNTACQLENSNAQYFITRATLYLDNGGYDRAIKDFNKAISLLEHEDCDSDGEKMDMLILALYRRAKVYHELKKFTVLKSYILVSHLFS